MTNPNHALFLALNASAEPSAAIVLLATICAKYLVLLVPLHLGLLWCFGPRSGRFVAVTAILALSLAFAASGIIGIVAYSPRPFVLGLGHTLVEHRPSAAFPSNHALLFFTYASVLAVFGHRALAASAGAVGVLVAWSRVYLGVHFPLDMVGAALLGGLAACLASQIAIRWGETMLRGAELVEARLPLPGRRTR